MSLTVTFNLPPEVEQKLRAESSDLNARVGEAFALELFRQGKLSHVELSQVLQLNRFETDAYLQRHKVYEGSLTMEDLDEQSAALDRALSKVNS